MKVLDDLTGRKFNRILVVGLAYKTPKSRRMWNCLCDCGGYTILDTYRIKSGVTRSCGCLFLETIATSSITHGMSYSSEYHIWWSVKARCLNPKHEAYYNYGGRGIKMCGKWLQSFDNFFKDMGSRPSKTHTLERKDNNKGYNPSNCVWATRKEQSRNKRNNIWIEHTGCKMILADWARELGLTEGQVHYHIVIKKRTIHEMFNYIKKK